MGPKYEFTDETKNYKGHLLHRIRRIEDGQLGGWIESEENLSQEGDCWVSDGALACGNTRVSGNAQIYDTAYVCNNAQVWGNARVYGNAFIYNNAQVWGNAQIFGDARVFEYAKVYGDVQVYGEARVCGAAQVYGNAKVYYEAVIYDRAKIYDDAQVYGHAFVSDDAQVYSNAKVYDHAHVGGHARIFGNAKVYDSASVRHYVGAHARNTEVNDKENNEDSINNEELAITKDFIYKIDESNKLKVKTEYSSIDEYFSSGYQHEPKLDTLIICTADTKIPIIKIKKEKRYKQLKYMIFVDLYAKNRGPFPIFSFIETKEQLSQKLTQIIEGLNEYPEFSKYIDTLADCL